MHSSEYIWFKMLGYYNFNRYKADYKLDNMAYLFRAELDRMDA